MISFMVWCYLINSKELENDVKKVNTEHFAHTANNTSIVVNEQSVSTDTIKIKEFNDLLIPKSLMSLLPLRKPLPES